MQLPTATETCRPAPNTTGGTLCRRHDLKHLVSVSRAGTRTLTAHSQLNAREALLLGPVLRVVGERGGAGGVGAGEDVAGAVVGERDVGGGVGVLDRLDPVGAVVGVDGAQPAVSPKTMRKSMRAYAAPRTAASLPVRPFASTPP
jgi:hypothetical protein